MRTNLRIGEILEDKGYVTAEQIGQALAYQKEHRDKRVGQILMELGFVTENQVLEALADRLHLEIVDVAQIPVDLKAVGMINRELAEKNLILPVSVKEHNMVLVTNDPLNYFALEEVRQQTGCHLEIQLSEEEPLKKAVSYYYAEVHARKAAKQANVGFSTTDVDELEIENLDNPDEAPIIQLLNSLIERAIKAEASDIHIEPFEQETNVRMRIDGVVSEYVKIQKNIHGPLIARIKILANLDIAEKRIPQDGHFRVALGDGQQVNIRVSVLPTVFGEKAVLRIMAATSHLDHADHFGMDEYSYNLFRPLLDYPNGIIYITGPTGSGKSTTLYMVLDYLSGRQVNISTIEDPVEKNLSGINQTQVNPTAGLTFDVGLRALMRQDPDIIMVGETRDSETASISVRSAITGHLVFSTLHTNDAASSIVRLIDMGVEPYLVANSMVGTVAQRLMRRICPECGQEVEATEEECRLLGAAPGTKIKKAHGCTQCNFTGYSGRIAVHEILTVDSTVRKMITDGASMDEIQDYAVRHQGMHLLRDSAIEKVLQQVTTIEELRKVAYYSDEPAAQAGKTSVPAAAQSVAPQPAAPQTVQMTEILHPVAAQVKEDPFADVGAATVHVEDIILRARESGCSDIHITAAKPLMIRINGALQETKEQYSKEQITAMLLEMCDADQRAQLAAGNDLDFAVQTRDGNRQRVNIFRDMGALAATIRLLNSHIPTLESLGLPMVLGEIVKQPRGLILVTGPTGSGKSTTLAAMIDSINATRPDHIITIEDPVEYVYEKKQSLIHQREVGRDVTSFAAALRSALREDPDIILVGEMRDYETISAALTAAETGHLVLSTLHTTGAAQTIDRIIDACPNGSQNQVRTQLAGVLNAVVTQCLIPKIEGGRIAATEILIGTDAVANMIRENKCHQMNTAMQAGAALGMHTLNRDLMSLVQRGVISMEQARKYTNDKRDFEQFIG